VSGESKEILRVLRALSVKGAALGLARNGRHPLIIGAVPAGAGYAAEAVGPLVARGLVANNGHGMFVITKVGAAVLRRSLAGEDEYAAQHQRRARIVVQDEETGAFSATVNRDESPLSRLRHRKDRDGRPLIDEVAFAAGERLRSDYDRGQLMPRITANWNAAVAGRGRDGRGAVALTDAAMAARLRVERALADAGPELGGMLVDFCCFLKGLEEIERERGWPIRSAKVVLKIGLAQLARHYGLGSGASGPQRSKRLRHWGAADYRPTID
jgi:hypothetical protein